jgi:hypothetical protein
MNGVARRRSCDVYRGVPRRFTGRRQVDRALSGRWHHRHTAAHYGRMAHRQSQLRLIAVAIPARLPSLPDLPTVAERLPAGLLDLGRRLPAAHTPRAIADRLSADFAQALRQRDIVQRFRDHGCEPVGGTPEGDRRFRAQRDRVVEAGDRGCENRDGLTDSGRSCRGSGMRDHGIRHTITTGNHSVQRGPGALPSR